MKQVIEIKGMSCNHCVMHVKEALLEIKDIIKVKVNLKKNTVTIKSKEEIKKEIIIQTIEEAGYQVTSVKF